MALKGEFRRLLRQQMATQAPKVSKGLFENFGKPAQTQTPFGDLSWWEQGIDLLSRSNYASAGFAKAALTGQGNPFEEALRGLKGEHRTTYSDVLGAAGMDSGIARSALGMAGDVLLDPLTYVTAGTGGGVKASVGGVTKTLTEVAGAAKLARTAELAERLGKLVPKMNEARKAKFVEELVLPVKKFVGKESDQLIAKLGAEELAGREVGGLLQGVAPKKGALASLKGLSAEKIVKPSAIRFMGAPLVKTEALTKPLKAGYSMAEKLPVVGQVFKGIRETGANVGKFLKEQFSTKSGLPMLDRIDRIARDSLSLEEYKAIKPIIEKHAMTLLDLERKGVMSQKEAWKIINEFQEGVNKPVLEMLGPAERVAHIGKQLDTLAKHIEFQGMILEEGKKLSVAQVEKELREKNAFRQEVSGKREIAEKSVARSWAKVKTLEEATTGAKKQAEARLVSEPHFVRKRTLELAGEAAKAERASLKESYEKDLKGILLELRQSKIVPSSGLPAEAIPKSMVSKTGEGLTLKKAGKKLAKQGLLPRNSPGENVLKVIQQAINVEKKVKGPIITTGVHVMEAAPFAAEQVQKELVTAAKAPVERELKKASAVLARKSEALGRLPKLETIDQQIVKLTSDLDQLKLSKGDPAQLEKLKRLNEMWAKKHLELANLPKTLRPVIDVETGEVMTQRVLPDIQNEQVKAIAEDIKKKYMAILEREKKFLPRKYEPIEEFYAHHVLKNDIKNMLVDVLVQGQGKTILTGTGLEAWSKLDKTQKLAGRPELAAEGELSKVMTPSHQRSFKGTINEGTIDMLIRSGSIDPSKFAAYAEKKGITMTADDLLIFEQDPLKAFVIREQKSLRAVSAAEFQRQVLESKFFTKAVVDVGDVEKIQTTLAQHPGHAVYIPSDKYFESMIEGRPAHGTTFLERVDSQEYLALQLDPANAKMKAYILPVEAAEHLARHYKMQFDSEATNAFLKTYDSFIGWWKMSATGVRPGFHVRNGISNLWQMMLGGFRDPRHLHTAMMLQNNPEAVARVGRYTGKEAAELADQMGLRHAGFFATNVGDTFATQLFPSRNPLAVGGAPARLGRKVGTAIEDNAKLALFVDGLEKGMDPFAASMRVKKYLFDYRDLTWSERNIFKRLFPFYAWTRKSIPLALEALVTQPGKVSAIGKIRENAEKNVEGSLERQHVSEFVRDAMGVPIRKTADGKVDYFLMRGWIPTTDIAKLDPQEIFGMLTPALKAPIEASMNKVVFTGKPIERFPGEKGKFLGIPMRMQGVNFLRNIVMAQEIDRLVFKDDWDLVKTPLTAIGIRTYKQDKVIQMRSRYYDLEKRMGEMKNAVKLATERYGPESEMVEQYRDEHEKLIFMRDKTKEDLLQIDPDALKTHKEEGGILGALKAPKERPTPATLEGMRARMRPNLSQLLHEPQKKVAR